MTFLVSICFILISNMLIFNNQTLNQIIASIVLLIAITEIIDAIFSGATIYAYRNSSLIEMSMYSAIMFVIFCVGIIFLNSKTGFASILLSSYSGGGFVRFSLPLIFLVPPLIAFLRVIGEWRELYSAPFGISLMTSAIMVLCIIYVFYYGNKLNEIDASRWRNQEILKSILDNANTFIYLKDLSGKYMLINRYWQSAFNIKDSDIINKTDADVFPYDFGKNFMENDQIVYKEKKPILFEEYSIRNGDVRYYLSNKFPIFNKKNEIYAIGGISTDITEKRLIEAEKSRLAEIVNSSSEAIVSNKFNFKITSWNPAAEKLYGFTEKEAIGKSIFIFIPEYEKQRIKNIIQSIKKDNMLVNFEMFIKNKNNELIPVFISFFPIKNADGVTIGASCIARNISIEKQREYDLIFSNEKLTAIMHGTNHSIIATDLNGNINIFNPAAEKMLGYKASEVIDKKTPLIFHDYNEIVSRSNELSKELNRHIELGFNVFVEKLTNTNVDQREWTYIRKDGTRFPVLLSVTALHGINNEKIGYVGIAMDITERKRNEMLKNAFISTVSHELRTPLTSIYGALGILDKMLKNENDKIKNMIHIAKQNSDRLIRLINDILDIEKIKLGKMTFNFQPSEVLSLINESINENLTYAEQYNVAIKTQFSVPAAMINADKDKILQVLSNLISNAIKFSFEGKVVTVKVDIIDRVVRVSVIDHGIGIPDEFKPLIFQEFTQADSSSVRKRGGTGLGLSICKAIIDKHGGTIDFTSEKDKGSDFYFELPLI